MTRRPLNLENEIKDLYSAERQLTKAFPKMAKGSNDVSLQAAFKDHLKETEAQVARLEEVAKLLDILDLGIIGAKPCGALRDGRLYDRN